MENFEKIENLIVAYFSNELSESQCKEVDAWRKESAQNEQWFKELQFTWEALPHLTEMERFNSFEALEKIHFRLRQKKNQNIYYYLVRIAAVLMFPLLLGSLFLYQNNLNLEKKINQSAMQKIYSRQGSISEFTLTDGTKVWLNSGSSIEFPIHFGKNKREVTLCGEAYFDVAKDTKKPFVVKAGKLNIEVLGTQFNVTNYEKEKDIEVILEEGKIKLSTLERKKTVFYGVVRPNEKWNFGKKDKKMTRSKVTVDKYITWRYGSLIFKDDPMHEVAKRLGRWFDVEIVIKDKELSDYIYTATFKKESLERVLRLLKLSAPIDFEIEKAKKMPNGEFSKEKIFLIKKK